MARSIEDPDIQEMLKNKTVPLTRGDWYCNGCIFVEVNADVYPCNECVEMASPESHFIVRED